jgi:hypothetical protein
MSVEDTENYLQYCKNTGSKKKAVLKEEGP